MVVRRARGPGALGIGRARVGTRGSEPPVNIVSLTDVRKSYGDRVVLGGVTLGLDAGEKMGLVGVNGSGKSTLFRVLVGVEEADGGIVARQRDLTVGWLPQDPPLPPDQTVWQTVAGGMAELLRARAEAEEVARRLEAHANDEAATAALLGRYEALQHAIERLGGWQTDHLVEEVLMHVGVLGVARTPVAHLSGGQRKRTALARVLLMRPRLLVLDEPTNHLDADTVDWLEETLASTDGAVALITHDRYFLDRVVERMVELEGGTVATYPGNYTAFLEQKRERLALHRRTEDRRLKLLEQELAWIARAPSARGTKQKARIQRAEALQQENDKAAPREDRLPLSFQPAAAFKGDTILNAVGLELGWGDGSPLVRDFTLRMVRGDKIGVIGPNGSGKTTLVKALLGLHPVRSGLVEVGRQTRLGYFDQERAGISPDATLWEAVAPNSEYVKVGAERIHVRRWLQDFLFPSGEQQRRVHTLSGGERNRLLLARLVAEGANLLVLDEPTNDLDLDTLQVLEDALARFAGCLLCVTHDRFFLNRVTNRILAFLGDGEVRSYAGDYDLYKRTRAVELSATAAAARAAASAAAVAAPAAKADAAPAARPRPGLSWKEARELTALEAEIAELEDKQTKVEARLADPTPFAAEPDKLTKLTQLHEKLATTLEQRYARWAELSERQEG
jgi:ATP-binding cassette subfamily F protein uup